MSDLLDLDRAGEGSFLGVVALKLQHVIKSTESGKGDRRMGKLTLTPCFSFVMQYAVTGG